MIQYSKMIIENEIFIYQLTSLLFFSVINFDRKTFSCGVICGSWPWYSVFLPGALAAGC